MWNKFQQTPAGPRPAWQRQSLLKISFPRNQARLLHPRRLCLFGICVPGGTYSAFLSDLLFSIITDMSGVNPRTGPSKCLSNNWLWRRLASRHGWEKKKREKEKNVSSLSPLGVKSPTLCRPFVAWSDMYVAKMLWPHLWLDQIPGISCVNYQSPSEPSVSVAASACTPIVDNQGEARTRNRLSLCPACPQFVPSLWMFT